MREMMESSSRRTAGGNNHQFHGSTRESRVRLSKEAGKICGLRLENQAVMKLGQSALTDSRTGKARKATSVLIERDPHREENLKITSLLLDQLKKENPNFRYEYDPNPKMFEREGCDPGADYPHAFRAESMLNPEPGSSSQAVQKDLWRLRELWSFGPEK